MDLKVENNLSSEAIRSNEYNIYKCFKLSLFNVIVSACFLLIACFISDFFDIYPDELMQLLIVFTAIGFSFVFISFIYLAVKRKDSAVVLSMIAGIITLISVFGLGLYLVSGGDGGHVTQTEHDTGFVLLVWAINEIAMIIILAKKKN